MKCRAQLLHHFIEKVFLIFFTEIDFLRKFKLSKKFFFAKINKAQNFKILRFKKWMFYVFSKYYNVKSKTF